MSKVGAILLTTDSAGALPGFETEKHPFIHVKPGEVVWNGMQTEEPLDPRERQLFFKNAEVNEKTSGLIEDPRWYWADSIADVSIEHDAIFVFAPHEQIFEQQITEIVKAQVLQKTHYIEFFRRHTRQSGKLKTFTVKTHNWFAGVGLVAWQAQQVLMKQDPNRSVSLAQIKLLFEQLSARTRTFSIMPCHQLHPFTRDQILEQSMVDKLRGNMGRNKWISFELGHKTNLVGERESLQQHLNDFLSTLNAQIIDKRMAFSRLIISCSNEQMAELKSNPAFLQMDKLQKAEGFKWLHQPAPITAQILTGKDAIHFSYSLK